MTQATRRPQHSKATDRGFTMAEMLVVMAIITILSGSLAVVLTRQRTRAMSARAGADIQILGSALEQYRGDIGYYPVGAYINTGSPTTCDLLYDSLTNRNSGGLSKGWGGASYEWKFLRGTVKTCATVGCSISVADNARHYTYNSGSRHQLLDPWGTPYYYLANQDYLRGGRVWEDGSATGQPIIFGTTERPNDFWGDPDDFDTGGVDDPDLPRKQYYGPPPRRDAFFNADSYQIHSKGPDQLTDAEDGDAAVIDACDRGADRDDINNFGQ